MYTVKEIAQALGVSVGAVRAWHKNGMVMEKKRLNGRLQYATSIREIENYLGRFITDDEKRRFQKESA